MIRPHKSTFKPNRSLANYFAFVAFTAVLIASHATAIADSVGFFSSFTGNYNFVVTGGSLRTGQCAVTSSRVATLSGVPTNSIVAAYLYWAGSGPSDTNGVVFFEGGAITDAQVDRSFTETVGSRTWFGGRKDVTGIVRDKTGGPNGDYTFSGLDVVTTGYHCDVGSVLAGWALVVIYEDTANEPLRVINLYDGLQNFRYSSFSLTPTNFWVPTSGIDGKFGVLTWEGDEDISDSDEELRFNATVLTNADNPAENQYNSTISQTGGMNNPNVPGVDFDVYDVSSYLRANDRSATTFYSSGQDRVLLGLEIISVTNTPVADLSIAKSHSGNFIVGQQGQYTITVTNEGPVEHTGEVVVTDPLPSGLTYVSASGQDWTCNIVGPGETVECRTTRGPIAINGSLPDITLTVDVDAAALPSVTNRATVKGALFDNYTTYDFSDDPTTVVDLGPSSGTKQLYFYMADAPSPDTNTIQRIVNPSQTFTGNIPAGNSYTASLSPPLQSALILQAGNIPVSVWLRRRNASGTSDGNGRRNITITLNYRDSGGTIRPIGSATRNNDLNTWRWRYRTFNINLTTDMTIPKDATLRCTITHGPGSIQGLQSRSANNALTQRSQIAFDTTTVINVDSVEPYSDVAYPGGVPQASYAPGTNSRIRAVVSDPFGHDDINSALITLNYPSGSPVPGATNQPMTLIATPLTLPPSQPSADGTKIYEYVYPIPQTGPNGTWTAFVTANEGTEGTISHQDAGTFMVGMPNVTINKTVTTVLKPNADLSDPTVVDPDAYAIPGATMRYDIVVSNTGIGPANKDSVVITDLLPPDLRLVLNSDIEPVRFIDGAISSGLTFTPGDVGPNDPEPFNAVALSNIWSGNPVVPVPGPPFLPRISIGETGGMDSTAPKINYIRINPKGIFRGAAGGPAPSFTLQFRLKIE